MCVCDLSLYIYLIYIKSFTIQTALGGIIDSMRVRTIQQGPRREYVIWYCSSENTGQRYPWQLFYDRPSESTPKWAFSIALL